MIKPLDGVPAGIANRFSGLQQKKHSGQSHRRISLSSAPFYASILVIFGLTLFIGVFWMVNEYQAYEESIENIRTNYHNRYRSRVQEEHGKVIDFIEYKRSLADQQIEDEIRDKVQAAYSIASHIYRLYKDEKSVTELRAMVTEVLRPIRWNNEQGYYFAGTVEKGEIDLFADEPWFEGKETEAVKEVSGVDVVGDIRSIVREKGAGVYHYDLVKPQFPGKVFPKIAFVKYFEPFDWFIGAGVYTEAMEKLLQADILARIRSMSFAKDGRVLGYRRDGTIICSRDERLIGRSVENFVDGEGLRYGQVLLTAADNAHGEFFTHGSAAGLSDLSHQVLSYAGAYRDWGWVFATSMSMEEMQRAIAFETQSYRDIAFKNVVVFIILFVVAVTMLLLISYFYSMKIRHGIDLFTNFLRQATDSKKKIKNTDLAFTEFEDLRILANRMVDDRIQKELLLRRDELRLDTLLRLGMMEKQSLQEKYDFVLRRIVQITRSGEGYLAMVNNSQSHITLCSLAKLEEGVVRTKPVTMELSRSVNKGGFAGMVVTSGGELLSNAYTGTDDRETLYPYSGTVVRHVDVPAINDGRIVMVAGVCNNGSEYDTSDIRQMKMLLEGMWLHVLKTCSEEEMARLERQIIMVSEEERANIGRDLHDDLGSHLTGVELLSKVLQQKLEQTDPDKAAQVGAIRGLIRDAIEKTRRLAQGLYPAHVIEHGLEAAVEELVSEIKNLFQVECTHSFEGDREWVDNAVATHVYYIIREAVFNAARHGEPDNIGIFMRTDTESFSVRIVDDGNGFDENSTRRGLGCHTMKYRAKAIGAELTISSELDGGTIVSVSGEVHT
ncbi:cache domain-containing protein [Desulfopila aestuarii]|uniref:histidine kinase n=1 Tax=Desulfopila aestuarii DSM 18488 TaxID=1121416 RepID=A0A1M7Y7Q3_9BACT|nr:cache domain-containing protein [Desulfopila aestuarii]SHO48657.1 Histidine kinase-, DNA gyrase B-, and HSP90-like ATPase [Desulfopila aestuarii DSM 18488]